MKLKLLWWLVAAAALIAACLYYNAPRDPSLNVTPEAREQIEKAKRR